MVVAFVVSPFENGLILNKVLIHNILNALTLFGSLINDGVFWIDDSQLFDFGELSFDNGAHHSFKFVRTNV